MTQPDLVAQFTKLQRERIMLELRDPATPETIQRIAELKQQELALIAATGSATSSGDTATPAEVDEMRQVLAEAYQVVGCMLSDLGIFHEDRAEKILDNLNEGRMVHQDVLPWTPVVPPDLTMELERLRGLAGMIPQGRTELDIQAQNAILVLHILVSLPSDAMERLDAGMPASNPLVALPVLEALRISIFAGRSGDWRAQAPGWLSDPRRKQPFVSGATMIEAGLRAVVEMVGLTEQTKGDGDAG